VRLRCAEPFAASNRPSGSQHELWFLEMSPYHLLHYDAFPEYLFHHNIGRLAYDTLRFGRLTLPCHGQNIEGSGASGISQQPS